MKITYVLKKDEVNLLCKLLDIKSPLPIDDLKIDTKRRLWDKDFIILNRGKNEVEATLSFILRAISLSKIISKSNDTYVFDYKKMIISVSVYNDEYKINLYQTYDKYLEQRR